MLIGASHQIVANWQPEKGKNSLGKGKIDLFECSSQSNIERNSFLSTVQIGSSSIFVKEYRTNFFCYFDHVHDHVMAGEQIIV